MVGSERERDTKMMPSGPASEKILTNWQNSIGAPIPTEPNSGYAP